MNQKLFDLGVNVRLEALIGVKGFGPLQHSASEADDLVRFGVLDKKVENMKYIQILLKFIVIFYIIYKNFYIMEGAHFDLYDILAHFAGEVTVLLGGPRHHLVKRKGF